MRLTTGCGRTIGVEASADADIVYVSHAHSDHLIKTSKRVLASEETIHLMRCGSGMERIERFTEMLDDVEMHPSGHILGSTQLRFANGHSVVYTSDMKLRDGYTTKGAEALLCDELHIDCTFGHPDFSFKPREELADSIGRWTKTRLMTGQNVIFGAYTTGKAQELIRILNDFTGETVIVDQDMEKRCAVYERFGVNLDRKVIGSPEAAEIQRDPFIYVIPFRHVNRDSERWFAAQYKRVTCALVTGWAAKFHYQFKAFPLSDHADFSEILSYVQQSGAKKVVCHYGHADTMAKELRNRGYDAITDRDWKQSQKEKTKQMTLVAMNSGTQ